MNRHQKEIDKEQVFYEMFQYSSDRYNQTQLHSHCGLLQEIFSRLFHQYLLWELVQQQFVLKVNFFQFPVYLLRS